ncbi:MAG: pilus assembly protein [Desulfobacteraceae bacterium]|jgi:Flp pilus assembly protein TadG
MKAIRKITSRIHDQTGASAVEFAIILPLLVVFLFGIIEFSIMFYDKAVITNASREGARRGILYTPAPRVDISTIENTVINYCQNHLITFGTEADPIVDIEIDVLLAPDYATENPGSPCTQTDDELIVTVTYHYDFLIVPDILAAFFSGGAFSSGSDIQAVTRMRCE